MAGLPTGSFAAGATPRPGFERLAQLEKDRIARDQLRVEGQKEQVPTSIRALGAIELHFLKS